MDNLLPHDLIIEILVRLPVKVLSKFRCVSKQWLQLLSQDKHFISRHSRHSMDNPLLLFRKYCAVLKEDLDDRVVIELTGTNMKGRDVTRFRVAVCGPVNTFTSCGHLVLLCCPYRIYVCNPGTEECILVPLSESVSRYCTVGFGRCSRPNDEIFKIVHLFPKDSFVGDEGMGCQVFSLTSSKDVNLGIWRRTVDCPYTIRTEGAAVCVGGSIYWMVSDEASELNNKSILSFDLETEEFESIPYPECFPKFEQNSVFLTGFNNCVCLVDDASARTWVTNVWIMRDEGKRNSWVKEYSFDLSSLEADGGRSIKISGIVPAAGGGGEIVLNTDRHGLLKYNVEKGTFTRMKRGNEERYKLPCLYHDGFFALAV